MIQGAVTADGDAINLNQERLSGRDRGRGGNVSGASSVHISMWK